MNRSVVSLIVISMLLILGCSSASESIPTKTDIITCQKEFLVKKQVNPQMKSIPSSHNDANMIKRLVSSLSVQLTRSENSIKIRNLNMSIDSFSHLNTSKKDSRFSDILRENLIYEMQIRDYKIVDIKSTDKTNKIAVEYVLIGTYSTYRSSTVVNARIVELKTGMILSTAQVLIPSRVVKKLTS